MSKREKSKEDAPQETSPDGRYIRLAKKLGSGAYKEVYVAMDQETGKEVAWNMVDLRKMPGGEKKRVTSETELLKELHHPHIINFYDVWRDDDNERICFITEIMTSGTLREYTARIKKFKLKVIKKWCRMILNGLDYLHSHDPPIIHRDLKCDNVFINGSTGEIRIGDFGLSAARASTHAQSVLGTPQFMAPELYDEMYTEKVDIYAFGMCLLEMTAQEYPYEECANAVQIWRKVVAGVKPAVLGRIRDGEVREFIELCLLPAEKRLSARELLNHPFLAFKSSDAREDAYIEVDDKPESDAKEDESAKTKEKPLTTDKTGALGSARGAAERADNKLDNATSPNGNNATVANADGVSTGTGTGKANGVPAAAVAPRDHASNALPPTKDNGNNNANAANAAVAAGPAPSAPGGPRIDASSPPQPQPQPTVAVAPAQDKAPQQAGSALPIAATPTHRPEETTPPHAADPAASEQDSTPHVIGCDADVESVDQEAAKLSFSLHFERRRKKQVKFEFRFLSDTPESIASEMVEKLRLPDADKTARMIATSIAHAVGPYRQGFVPAHQYPSYAAAAEAQAQAQAAAQHAAQNGHYDPVAAMQAAALAGLTGGSASGDSHGADGHKAHAPLLHSASSPSLMNLGLAVAPQSQHGHGASPLSAPGSQPGGGQQHTQGHAHSTVGHPAALAAAHGTHGHHTHSSAAAAAAAGHTTAQHGSHVVALGLGHGAIAAPQSTPGIRHTSSAPDAGVSHIPAPLSVPGGHRVTPSGGQPSAGGDPSAAFAMLGVHPNYHAYMTQPVRHTSAQSSSAAAGTATDSHGVPVRLGSDPHAPSAASAFVAHAGHHGHVVAPMSNPHVVHRSTASLAGLPPGFAAAGYSLPPAPAGFVYAYPQAGQYVMTTAGVPVAAAQPSAAAMHNGQDEASLHELERNIEQLQSASKAKTKMQNGGVDPSSVHTVDGGGAHLQPHAGVPLYQHQPMTVVTAPQSQHSAHHSASAAGQPHGVRSGSPSDDSTTRGTSSPHLHDLDAAVQSLKGQQLAAHVMSHGHGHGHGGGAGHQAQPGAGGTMGSVHVSASSPNLVTLAQQQAQAAAVAAAQAQAAAHAQAQAQANAQHAALNNVNGVPMQSLTPQQSHHGLAHPMAASHLPHGYVQAPMSTAGVAGHPPLVNGVHALPLYGMPKPHVVHPQQPGGAHGRSVSVLPEGAQLAALAQQQQAAMMAAAAAQGQPGSFGVAPGSTQGAGHSSPSLNHSGASSISSSAGDEEDGEDAGDGTKKFSRATASAADIKAMQKKAEYEAQKRIKEQEKKKADELKKKKEAEEAQALMEKMMKIT